MIRDCSLLYFDYYESELKYGCYTYPPYPSLFSEQHAKRDTRVRREQTNKHNYHRRDSIQPHQTYLMAGEVTSSITMARRERKNRMDFS